MKNLTLASALALTLSLSALTPTPAHARDALLQSLDPIASCRIVTSKSESMPKGTSVQLFVDVLNWQHMGCERPAQAQVALSIVSPEGPALVSAMLDIGNIRLPGYGSNLLDLTLRAIDEPGYRSSVRLYGKLDSSPANRRNEMSVAYIIHEEGYGEKPHDERVDLRCTIHVEEFSQRQVQCPR